MATMSGLGNDHNDETVENLIPDLVEWLARKGRSYLRSRLKPSRFYWRALTRRPDSLDPGLDQFLYRWDRRARLIPILPFNDPLRLRVLSVSVVWPLCFAEECPSFLQVQSVVAVPAAADPHARRPRRSACSLAAPRGLSHGTPVALGRTTIRM
jgi:hypothetical protein